MTRITSIALLPALLAAVGCGQMVKNKEDMLAAAGFKTQVADTPARQTELRKMPSHQFTMQVRNNQSVWVYADPSICNCVYFGNQMAYDTYRQMMYQQHLAQEVQNIQPLNQNNAFHYPFAWEAWGPATPYY